MTAGLALEKRIEENSLGEEGQFQEYDSTRKIFFFEALALLLPDVEMSAWGRQSESRTNHSQIFIPPFVRLIDSDFAPTVECNTASSLRKAESQIGRF